MERISLEEAHARMKGQGVSSREHVAFKCPVCGTVQSMASLIRAGADRTKVESLIGFSCEGRITRAGAWPAQHDTSKAAGDRRGIRGCDWTLGGLLPVHELEVEFEGQFQPSFVIATPEAAKQLEEWITRKAAT